MDTQQVVSAILAAMKSGKTFETLVLPTNSPERLMTSFRERGVPERGFLLPDELEEIALVKNGGKLSTKTREALWSNSKDTIERLTRMALGTDDPELAVRLLLGLDGVRLPTATCILAWTLPHKWPVIDVRAWRALVGFSKGILVADPPGGLKVRHWRQYFAVVKEVATTSAMTPQAVDVWLYRYDKHTANP
ncbi:hypothetical protein [Sinorhizobium sp. CCBAU 05631]|uniref:hypothetical protein n=1 Tax=Sinorhizobium sp. CCBAU 05631 TaxID=794846 RepID=UPI00056BBCD0|nr:hypothetical protein [Sinorhizobium sp. CCBAU 05631]